MAVLFVLFFGGTVKLVLGNCKEKLKGFEDNSIDAVVSDAPYELKFNNKKWDNTGISYDVELWQEVLRVVKPGAHILIFGGSRTHHRLAVAIEDAGFQIRDTIFWIYGEGFPKSLDIDKEIKKKRICNNKWQGWGTGLKPAVEPIVLARKPISEKTIAENVLKWGTGGLNIRECRIGSETLSKHTGSFSRSLFKGLSGKVTPERKGRWPANVIFDEEAGRLLDKQSGKTKTHKKRTIKVKSENRSNRKILPMKYHCPGNLDYGDAGGASRFFYCAKASKKEKNLGCKNNHCTVKPLKLMRYLCRLITPSGGVILDHFMGTASTGLAALQEGFNFIGIEKDKDYFSIATKRIKAAKKQNIFAEL